MNTKDDLESLALRIAFEGDLERFLLRHTSLICWNDGEVSPVTSIADNGTCCLVQTPQTRFIVTCAHVWNGFEDHRRKHPSATLWLSLLGGDRLHAPALPLPIAHPVEIAKNEALDLMTFTFCGIDSLESWRFCQFGFQCASRVHRGDQVFFIGYSGDSVRAAGLDQRLGHNFFTIAVADVSHRQFILHNQSDERHFYDHNNKEIAPIRAPGLSGAPVFHVPPLLPMKPRLVGVLSQVSSPGLRESLESTGDKTTRAYELADGDIYITHADFIGPDGTFKS